jgi:hypothetical protein
MNKLDQKQLELFSWVANRRTDQMRKLYELCDEDFNKLLKLEAKLKRLVCYLTPGTKEAVDQVLLDHNNTCEKVVEAMNKVANDTDTSTYRFHESNLPRPDDTILNRVKVFQGSELPSKDWRTEPEDHLD